MHSYAPGAEHGEAALHEEDEDAVEDHPVDILRTGAAVVLVQVDDLRVVERGRRHWACHLVQGAGRLFIVLARRRRRVGVLSGVELPDCFGASAASRRYFPVWNYLLITGGSPVPRGTDFS